MAEDPKGGRSVLILRCRHPDAGPLADHLCSEIPPTDEYSTGRSGERPDSVPGDTSPVGVASVRGVFQIPTRPKSRTQMNQRSVCEETPVRW